VTGPISVQCSEIKNLYTVFCLCELWDCTKTQNMTNSFQFLPNSSLIFVLKFDPLYVSNKVGNVPLTQEVHKIPARVQCTVQVCELAVSNLHPPPYRSRQVICLSHSESVRLPFQLPMRPSSHQLQAGPGSSIPCTVQQHTSSHAVHLCVN
jgi:hypothetical protein